jgi:hypothetical protein
MNNKGFSSKTTNQNNILSELDLENIIQSKINDIKGLKEAIRLQVFFIKIFKGNILNFDNVDRNRRYAKIRNECWFT